MINLIHPKEEIHNGMLKDVPNKSPLKKFPSFSPTIFSQLDFIVINIYRRNSSKRTLLTARPAESLASGGEINHTALLGK
jgi:hypothetical protein